jgi:WD40 repeat protein
MSGDGDIRVWGFDGSLVSLPQFSAHAGFVFAKDGKSVFVCLPTGHGQQRVCAWNLQSSSGLHCQRYVGQDVQSLALSPDGRFIASTGTDCQVILWDLANNKQLPPSEPIHPSVVKSLAFHPSGDLLISGDRASNLFFWKVTPEGLQQIRQQNWQQYEINDMTFSSSLPVFASVGNDGRVRIFDTDGYRSVENLQGHANKTVYSIAFSPCGKRLASAGCDHTIRIWKVRHPNHVA